MKKPMLKFFDKIILILLGIIGAFSGCKPVCEYDDMPFSRFRYPEGGVIAKYGMPAVHIVKGDVKNNADGKPIPNIRIIAENSDTLYTDSQGKYIFKFDVFTADFCLLIDDIDGEENGGHFKSQVVDVALFPNEEDVIKKGACEGYFVKTEKIKLKKADEFELMYGVKSAPFEP